MSVTSGFFNSVNHDRRYNAAQMSAIFDGIINDGVFANIGVAFAVSAHTGVTISIGKGRAWFNSAWVYNDGPLLKTLEGSEVVLDRIDAVVIEVDHNENVRLGDIKIVKGTPTSTPQRPKMAADTYKHQYPLAYIYRKAGSTTITQADITSMIGTSSCPYITGILQVQNIDNIVAQWGAQWNQWYSEMVSETNADASELLAEMRSEFEIWFRDVANILEGDVGANLTAQVAELMGKFDDLARDACVYDTIEDSDLDIILGSDGTPIQGKTVFSGSGSGSIEGVTAKDIGAIAIDGSTPMTGNLDVNQNRIMNVAEPEEDSDAASAGYVKSVIENSKTPSTIRNLLINSDFTNPVNQNGLASYVGNWIYSVDRWMTSDNNARVDILSDGIKLSSNDASGITYIFQRLAKLPPGTYTFAAKFKENTGLVSISNHRSDIGAVVSPTSWDTEGILILNFVDPDEPSSTDVFFRLCNGTDAIWEWAALYEGEYTAETLPEYHSIGYENELLVCRQYDPNTGEYIGLRKFGTAHNLLDNSDFTNLVNRKGQNSYTTNIGFDRWRIYSDNTAMTKNDGYMAVTGVVVAQNVPDVKNKIYTCAAMTVEGTLYLAKGTFEAGANDGQVSFNIATVGQPTVFLGASNWLWAALYEGEFTIDTLPEYQPKGYEQELLICNQYDINTGEYIGLRKFGQPHNLLDNSDFRNPVNQRGKTSYSAQGYTIDKWLFRTGGGGESATIEAAGIRITKKLDASNYTALKQPRNVADQKMAGKTVTFVANIIEASNSFRLRISGSATEVSDSRVYAQKILDTPGIHFVTCTLPNPLPNDYLATVVGLEDVGTILIGWTALYEGLYTADTLPEYQPKGKQVEALNCGAIPGPMDLLWQNASPTTAFDAQTVTVDLSLYNWVLIETNFSNEHSERATMLAPITDGVEYSIMANRSGSTVARRFFTPSKTGITFKTGASGSSNGAKYMIPVKIYGVKG